MNNSNEDKPDVYSYNKSLFTTSDNRYEISLNNILARYIKIDRLGVLTICEVVVIEGSKYNLLKSIFFFKFGLDLLRIFLRISLW